MHIIIIIIILYILASILARSICISSYKYASA